METFCAAFASIMLLSVSMTIHQARAEGGDDDSAPQASQDTPESAAAPEKKAPKRVTTGEKETDGTTAPNRFQADTVIKSQYKLDGEQLEVDPD